MTHPFDGTSLELPPAQVQRYTETEELIYRFLLSSAHEMRPRLSSLDWLIKATLDQWGDALSAEARHYLETALADVSRLWRTTRDLDDFARLQRGTTGELPQTATLHEALRHVVTTLRPALESKRLSLSIDLPDHVKMLAFDAGSLNIIFRNLLSNSAKFTESGGRVWVLGSLSDDRQTARLIINDRATPVPPEKRDGIFDDLRPLENFLTHRPEGMGLGLAVARRVARMLEGDITLDAREDGNSFIISLPLQEQG